MSDDDKLKELVLSMAYVYVMCTNLFIGIPLASRSK